MAQDDVQMARARGAGGLDVVHGHDRHDRGPDDTGEKGRHGDTDGQNEVAHAVAQSCHDGQREQQRRQTHEHIDDAHDNGVKPAAEITAAHTEDETCQAGDGNGGKGDEQRRTGAVDNPGEDVPSKAVGAERMLQAG